MESVRSRRAHAQMQVDFRRRQQTHSRYRLRNARSVNAPAFVLTGSPSDLIIHKQDMADNQYSKITATPAQMQQNLSLSLVVTNFLISSAIIPTHAT